MLTFGWFNTTTALVVLGIALVIFGPGKLPELGGALGKGIKEFKSASDGEKKQAENEEVKSESK
ncbi:MAG: twin-arginine translocase TatA/TatE family subunit [Peptococcaceae bacterium]|nr:twin-arginine translocase TatA/TatE family subunit [Peptococcaceae bacterium]